MGLDSSNTGQIGALKLTRSLEDYLETIYDLIREQPVARVRDIAKARNVRAASVSPALKRLAELGLVAYQRREYVTLTERGAEEARRIYSRHQLLTRFFAEVLQMPRALAERDACAMEHELSDEGMDRFARFFEFLSTCPETSVAFLDRLHGCPRVQAVQGVDEGDVRCGDCVGHIGPGRGLTSGLENTMTIRDLKPGATGVVTQVNASGAIRQRLLDMGMLPDSKVEIERVAPTGEPIWLRLHGTQLALRRAEAEAVVVVSG